MGWEMALWVKYLWHKCEFRFTERTSVLGGHGGLPVILTLKILRWSPLNNLASKTSQTGKLSVQVRDPAL